MSGVLRSVCLSNVQIELESSRSHHIDQGVDTEQVDLAANEIGDSRLGDTEETGGLTLGQSSSLDIGRLILASGLLESSCSQLLLGCMRSRLYEYGRENGNSLPR